MAKLGGALKRAARRNHTDRTQFGRMAHANVALCAIDEHREAVRPDVFFNLLDSEIGKVSRDQQIIRAQHSWMAGIVYENRARAAIEIINLDDADLFVDGTIISAATINTDSVNVAHANANLSGKTIPPGVGDALLNSLSQSIHVGRINALFRIEKSRDRNGTGVCVGRCDHYGGRANTCFSLNTRTHSLHKFAWKRQQINAH